MLLHIPHSSTNLPQSLNAVVPWKQLWLYTDWLTDKLFDCGEKMVYPWSRFYCDVERLFNDPLESEGHGLCYTHLYDGTRYRDSNAYDTVIAEYHAWHDELRRRAESHASMLEAVTVVDCHSFSAAQVNMDDDDLPDICIGYNDSNHLPEALMQELRAMFTDDGYTVKDNVPYGGAIIASSLPNVYSIMIEVNKRRYLGESFDPYCIPKITNGFPLLKKTITKVLHRIEQFDATGA